MSVKFLPSQMLSAKFSVSKMKTEISQYTALRVLIFFSLSFFTSASVFGQNSSTTASISGVVHDPAGKVIPNVSITLRDPATNLTRKTVSDSDGNYRITALIVSAYEVRAESESFAVYINPQ